MISSPTSILNAKITYIAYLWIIELSFVLDIHWWTVILEVLL